jgi:hypothetical protein
LSLINLSLHAVLSPDKIVPNHIVHVVTFSESIIQFPLCNS